MALGRKKRTPKTDYFKTALSAVERLRKHTVAVMVTPTFTASQLAEMMFRPHLFPAIRAGASFYECNNWASSTEYHVDAGLPNGVAAYIELNPKAAGIVPPRTEFVRSVIEDSELREVFREVYELQVKWLKVKTVVKWFEENATHTAARAFWPALNALTGAKDEPPTGGNCRTKTPMGPMLELIRETGVTVAASVLLPPAVNRSGESAFTIGVDDLEYPFYEW